MALAGTLVAVVSKLEPLKHTNFIEKLILLFTLWEE